GTIGLFHRRGRILRRARAFERIAAGLFLAADIAGLAGGAAQLFETIVIGFDLLVAQRPVLDRHVGRQEALAVTLLEMAAAAKIGRQEAPGLAVPVDARPADAVAGQEARPLADRQRGLSGIVAERQRLLGRAQEQIEPD